LNHCIQFDDNDKLHVRYNPKELIKQSGIRGNSADDDDESSDNLSAEATATPNVSQWKEPTSPD
jgi:hypothetical protein